MHAEAAPETIPGPNAGEWAIGAAFVLAALLFVAWIAWSIARL